MQTLLIANGDLALSGGQLATVDGPAKIEQDLGVALLTPYGSDHFHPGFGSTLGSMVGQPATGAVVSGVTAEVNRVVQNYMSVQQSVVNTAALAGNPSPYAQNELVGTVRSVNAVQNTDEIDVTIDLLTIAGEPATVTVQPGS